MLGAGAGAGDSGASGEMWAFDGHLNCYSCNHYNGNNDSDDNDNINDNDSDDNGIIIIMVMMIMSGCWFVVMKNAVCAILLLCVLFLRSGHLMGI